MIATNKVEQAVEQTIIVVVLYLLCTPWLVAQETALGSRPVSSALQPAALIEVAPRYRYALIAELDAGKLHIFERKPNGGFSRVKTMEVSIGKEGYGKQVEGDNKTPIGVYRITSHLTNEQLDDFYGNAAYPVNYPNAWDKLHQRTGYGIWLHAEPIGLLEKTRPLRDSNGCVVLSNNDIDQLKHYLDIGYTYIVLTPRMQMTSAEAVSDLRNTLYQRINAWQLAWESRKPQAYLDFYSQSFSNLTKDWSAWAQYKTRINGLKTFIDVNISDVGIYRYPNEENLLWVEYYQSYRSSNYQSDGWKRQLWQLEEDGQWRIIYEGGG
ncbi:MAG: L,D-transpeptidase family protein [Pseudomonadota bacterium]